jgi:hypothetical protein
MRVQALSMEGFPMPDRRAFVTQLAAGAALLPAALRSRGYAQDPVLDTIPGRTAPGHRELVPWRPEPFRNHQVALRPGLVLTAGLPPPAAQRPAGAHVPRHRRAAVAR